MNSDEHQRSRYDNNAALKSEHLPRHSSVRSEKPHDAYDSHQRVLSHSNHHGQHVASVPSSKTRLPLSKDPIAKTVLNYMMFNQMIQEEFLLTFRHLAPRITSHPLPDLESLAHLHVGRSSDNGAYREHKIGAALPVVAQPMGPLVLPPISRVIYARFIRSLPFFAGRGEAFMKPFDDFAEEAFVPLVVTFARATKFDVLGFAKHYLAILFFAGFSPRDQRLGADPNKTDDEDVYHDASEHDTLRRWDQFQAHVMHHLSAKAPIEGGRFRHPSSLPLGHRNMPLEPTNPHLQEFRYHLFRESWWTWLQSSTRILLDMQQAHHLRRRPSNASSTKSSSSSTPSLRQDSYDEDVSNMAASLADFSLSESLFSVIRKCTELRDLPSSYRAWVKKLIRALAVTAENVLDDAEWRRKVTEVWEKLPLGLIVTSLKVVNPIPFIEKVLKIFLWKPPGLPSLLMKICDILCGLDRTKQRLKAARKPLSSSITKPLDAFLENVTLISDEAHFKTPYTDAFKDTKKAWTYSSDDSDEVIIKLLASNGFDVISPKGTTVDALIEYVRCFFRKREKEAFVDYMGSTQFVQFVTHVSAFLPPLLTEVWDCIDMSVLVSAFFKATSSVLDLLKVYDAEPKSDGSGEKKRYEGLIRKIEEEILEVIDKGYTMVHNLSKKAPGGPSGIHAALDWVGREAGDKLWKTYLMHSEERESLAETMRVRRGVLDMRMHSAEKLAEDCQRAGEGWEAALERGFEELLYKLQKDGPIQTSLSPESRGSSGAVDPRTIQSSRGRVDWLMHTYAASLGTQEVYNMFGGADECRRVYSGDLARDMDNLSISSRSRR
ncbi:hypothetical protein HDV05_007156 [Chytridiales sp. JEL 0842]|nr:hypothetical protein HDV05_007156 [Chytridiales sp. JEL 0842]